MRPGGEPFERYTLLELLGRGAAAAVYRAYDPLGNREVALKLLTAKGERQLLRFQREARTMSQLRHPHLVPVFRGGLVGTQAYLAMELVEGPTLDSLSQPGRTLPTFEAVAYLRDVALAIQYAHDMGVVHRDLKPSNVLIDSSRKARVVDFGVAHVQRESGAALTHSGTLLGTAAYMAPEQAAGQAADARSDVYALGATLYHALTGHAPYEDQETSPLVAVHRGQPTPIRKLCARPVPPRLVKAVRRAMAREPAARFPSAGAFATELEAILAAGYAPNAVGLRSWKLGVGALLALLVAGALALVVAELGGRVTEESRPLPAERLTTQLATLRGGVAEDASPAGLLRVLAEARGLVASEPALGAQLEATQLELAPRVLQQAEEAARRAEPFDAATAQRYALAVELATGEARWGAALARARYFLHRGRWTEGIEALGEVVEKAPRPLALKARYLSTDALGRSGDREGRNAGFEALAKEDPTGVVGRTAEATILAYDWDYNRSNEILRSVLADEPDYHPAQLRLALGLSFRSGGAEARQVLEQALRAHPGDYRVHATFGYAWMHEDPSASRAAFTRGMQLTSPWVDLGTLKWRGIVAMRSGDIEAAKLDFDGVLEGQPDQADVRVWRGLAFWQQGQRKSAADDWRKAYALSPEKFRRRLGDMPPKLRETMWRIASQDPEDAR